MTDRQIFEHFMAWMGMTQNRSAKNCASNELVKFCDGGDGDPRFTKCGYDEFYAGAEFDANGVLVRGFLDSHVAHSSVNEKAIYAELKALETPNEWKGLPCPKQSATRRTAEQCQDGRCNRSSTHSEGEDP